MFPGCPPQLQNLAGSTYSGLTGKRAGGRGGGEKQRGADPSLPLPQGGGRPQRDGLLVLSAQPVLVPPSLLAEVS